MKQKNDQLSLGFQVEQKKKITWLTHTAIEGALRCRRCFWLAYKQKIRQPEGIVSRLASRFDIVFKKYFDTYRGTNELPPVIKDKIRGILQFPFQERYYMRVNEKYGFYGKLDECIIENGKYVPVDFKTSSSDPREKESVLEAYQHQIDEYAYLMEHNKLPIAGYGYLIFFYPELKTQIHDGFPMVVHIQKIEAHIEGVRQRIDRAIEILEGPIPDSSESCPFCLWYRSVESFYTS